MKTQTDMLELVSVLMILLLLLPVPIQPAATTSVITIYKQGANTVVQEGLVIHQNNTDTVGAIRKAVLESEPNGEIFIQSGNYYLDRTINFDRAGLYVHGAGANTVLNYSGIGERNALTMSVGMKLADLTIRGSIDPFPGDFTQKVYANHNATIQGITISNMGYGLELAGFENIAIMDYTCEYVQNVQDHAACIHGESGTNNVMIDNFVMKYSNRGIELDAGTSNVYAGDGYMEHIRNFNGTGFEAFSLDVHSHDGEGISENVVFSNVTLVDSYGPTAKVGGVLHSVDDMPRNVTFQYLTMIRPTTTLGINGANIAVLNSTVIDPQQNVVSIYKNSENVTISYLNATNLLPNKYFVMVGSDDTDVKSLWIKRSKVELNDNYGDIPPIYLYKVEDILIMKTYVEKDGILTPFKLSAYS